VLGLAEASALSFPERLTQVEVLNARVAAAISERPRDELVTELTAAGVPASPVLSQVEMLAAEQFRHRGLVVDGSDGEPAMGHPVRYERPRPT